MNLYNLEAIKNFTGLNDETVDLLAKTFLEELEESNKEIIEIKETEDKTLIRRAIHKIKPGYIMFGFSDIIPVINEILEADPDSLGQSDFDYMISEYLEFSVGLEAEMKSKLQ